MTDEWARRGDLERVSRQPEAQAPAVRREPLLLPAPVERLEIPGINAIPVAMPVRKSVHVS